MKLTVLGSGTAASQLPNIPNRYPPAFLLEFGSEKLLFELSEGVRFRLEQAGFLYSDIHHVAVSHIHPDHCAIVHFIQSVFANGIWSGKKNEKINFYVPQQIIDAFPKLWDMHLPEMEGKPYEFPELKFFPMPNSYLNIGGGRLLAMSVYHGFGKVDAVAFKLEFEGKTMVYSGDTGECPGIREICKNADLFVCESSSRVGDENGPKEYGHLNPRLAGEIAREGNVKKLVFFHYTGLDSDEAIIADCKSSGFKGEIVVGKDFQVFEI